ncbi:diguanylate cyclase [Pseudofrankia sp. BMG5.36]|uniref:diguanylate cyclase domain-containing protein n=1 Tax=Pseudofrankia sp. BMG5.36 TaxID=1834512 RepID=UPI001042705B|nr:diguanylate cyclase [Pseudofrankia sp. BMG5.36]
MTTASPRAGQAARRFAVGLAGFTVAVVICALVLPSHEALTAIRAANAAATMVGTVICAWTASRHHGVERWWRALVGVMLLFGAVIAVPFLLRVAEQGNAIPEFDATVLVFLVPFACGLAGLMLYPSQPYDVTIRGPTGHHDRRWLLVIVLDSLIVTGALALLAWIIILDSLVRPGTRSSEELYSFGLTTVGVVQIVAVVLVLAFRRLRRPGGLILLGLGQFACIFPLFVQIFTEVRGLTDYLRLFDLGYVVGPPLIALATLLPTASASAPASAPSVLPADADLPEAPLRRPRRRWWQAALPYVPLVAAGGAALAAVAGQRGLTVEMCGLLALLTLTLARQMVTLADNLRLVDRVEEDQVALRHLAFHDPLTGLANRALFTDRLAHALSRQARAPGRLAVLFCDLDGFKRVNDTLGHAAGDELLRLTARRLRAAVRASDTVARLGGDEFAVLLEAADPAEVARRLTDAVREPFLLAGAYYVVRASTGLAVVEPAAGPVNAETLLHHADLAMYTAKAQGDGGLVLYSPRLAGPDTLAALHAALGAAIRGDPAGGRLVVDYRPVVELVGRTSVAHEARLTWHHPTLGTVPVDRMLTAATAAGLAPALDELLFQAACAHAASHPDAAGGPLPVHIPLSAARLAGQDITRQILAAVDATGVRPQTLVLKLAGTSRAPDLHTTARALRRLHDLGVRISLAEVGTTDTIPDALRILPIDMVVLHESLIAALSGTLYDPATAALSHAYLTAALRLGLTTIADGVADECTAACAHDIGCRQASGRLFGDWHPERPGVPAETRPRGQPQPEGP